MRLVSEVNKMENEEELGLNEVELDRLQRLAECPELADPILALIPVIKRRGGAR